MDITVKVNGMDRVTGNLSKLAKQIPFAASRAINNIAKSIQEEEIKEMKRVFDRPTPWILKGTYIQPALKTDLKATIGIKDFGGGTPAVKVLRPQIYGGDRNLKRFEKALQKAGVMPEGMFAVPGAGATLDMFGNMSRSHIVKILSWFRAFGEQGYKANITEKKKEKLKKGTKKDVGTSYFAIHKKKGKLIPGIYQKFYLAHGVAIKPVIIFVSKSHYKPRYDFFGVGKRTFDRVVQSKMQEALDGAIKSAR